MVFTALDMCIFICIILFSKEETTLESHGNPQDQSMSSFEASFSHPIDTSYAPITSQSSSPTSGSDQADTPSTPAANNWSQKKWIVNEFNLMQLFKTCHQCGAVIEEEDRKVTTTGSRIHIKWMCLQGHSGEWESCPLRRGMAENNLLVASSILFTGSTFTEISDWAEVLNLQIPQKTTFYELQKVYLVPVIEQAYRDYQEDSIRNLQRLTVDEGLSICGDGRSDSPGHSAKYTTYSFMNNETKEIIMVDLVQVKIHSFI